MASNIILCPHCGKEIELQAAMSLLVQNEIAEKSIQLESEQKKKNEAALQALRNEITLQMQTQKQNEITAAIEQYRKEQDEQSKKIAELEKEKLEALQKQKDAESLMLQKQNELSAKEAEINNAKEQLQKENESFLLQEKNRLLESVRMEHDSEIRLKQAESDQLVASLTKQTIELQRKLEQTSQQLQGEAQEVALEEILKIAFPGDIVEPVGKGVAGADCYLRVRAGNTIVGTIIFESKRTKQWANDWLLKLKDNQRSAKAEIAVLVTQAFPSDLKNKTGNIDGVWITDFSSAIGQVMALRAGLIEVARVSALIRNSEGKDADVVKFITGIQFKQAIQAIAETFIAFESDLASEKRAMEKQWKKREATIKRALTATFSIHSSLQGILGNGALPDIDETAAKQLTA